MTPKKIALLTDSCADLDPMVAEENHIYVVPLQIQCGDGVYEDGVSIGAEDVYRRLKSGEIPKTSLPSGAAMEKVFDRIKADGYDGVIAVMLSSGLSGTYNMTCIHGEEREDLKIAVYDSVSGSLGEGVVMLQLAEDIRAGMEWKELVRKRVPKLIESTKAFFSVDTLEYLRKGGRIGKVTAMAGTMLQIKPLLTFAPDGQLTGVAKVRGRRQVQDKLVELAVAACGKHKKYNLAVANGGAIEFFNATLALPRGGMRVEEKAAKADAPA
ncbi:MAG: DegV family protein, partial [Clostridia bacterium]|nr:DegV family protein [Clostridia bacterium]